jgi:hypothetical protein
LFDNFQIHWPVLHSPTFDVIDAYDGLLLCMICVGAVYSDRIQIESVRALMDCVKRIVHQRSAVYAQMRNPDANPRLPMHMDDETFQDFHGLGAMQSMFLWHGTPAQRQSAMDEYCGYIKLLRRYGMMRPAPPGGPMWSILHQPRAHLDRLDPLSWDWSAWIWQEQRSRLMYSFFLLDSAMAIYFNLPPQVDPFEVELPLPADDAAFEAATSDECAMALGLLGPEHQKRNVTGTRQGGQPEMNLAMEALMQPSLEFPNGWTNALSKFILIHALHVLIWRITKAVTRGNHTLETRHLADIDNALSANPGRLSRLEGSAHTSRSASGQATPSNSSGARSPAPPHVLLRATTIALAKWKNAWDRDLADQYPPDTKRAGFCRDAAPFWYLAQTFLTDCPLGDWRASPARRFQQVMNILKSTKPQVISENAQRGDEPGTGSLASMDDRYGIGNLAKNLDMSLLLKRVAPDTPSPPLPRIDATAPEL